MIKATIIFGTDAARHYDQTGEMPDPEMFNDSGCMVRLKEFSSKGHYDAYVAGLEDYDGFNDYRVIECEETPPQTQEKRDRTNAEIISLSVQLAEKAMVDRHKMLPDGFYEPDTECYREEFQDEFNRLYDGFHNQLCTLANFHHKPQ